MPETYLIGLDFGSELARGVLIDVGSGRQCAYHVHPYRHGIMTRTLPGGRELPAGFALQNAPDYLEAAETILKAIGADRDVAAIGVDFDGQFAPAGARRRPQSVGNPARRAARLRQTMETHAGANATPRR